MQKLSILISIFLSAILAFVISGYYGITPHPYFFIILVAFGLFVQTIIFILQFKDIEEPEGKAKEVKR